MGMSPSENAVDRIFDSATRTLLPDAVVGSLRRSNHEGVVVQDGNGKQAERHPSCGSGRGVFEGLSRGYVAV